MTDIVTVDTRGLSCPQPVLETRRVLEQSGAHSFRVLVDNVTSRENISRFARNQGCAVAVADLGADQFELTIHRSTGAAATDKSEELIPCAVPHPVPSGKHVVYIGTTAMGKGDEQLGEKLMRGFLRTLIDVSPLPWRVIFINGGVKLTTIDEEAVEAVSLLHDKGVEILSCGTCLQHFSLENSLKVGKVTNMFEVIESFNTATKVISPD